MVEINDNDFDLTVYVIMSASRSLNRKTLNSLLMLDEFKVNIEWLESIGELSSRDLRKDNGFSLFLNGGDHVTKSFLESFLESFLKNKINFLIAYQPEYSYIFSNRGKIFFRKNIDITPGTDEVNALLLYPHVSRHIIFPTVILKEILKRNFSNNFYWGLCQTIIELNLPIVSLNSSISLEHYDLNILLDKEQIYSFSDPVRSELHDKEQFLLSQNFSDLYE